MFGVGTGEVLFILFIAILIFGPDRMVKIAGEIGHFVAKIRKETEGVTREFKEAFSLEDGGEDEAKPKAQADLPEGAGGPEGKAAPTEAGAEEGSPSQLAGPMQLDSGQLEAKERGATSVVPTFLDGEIGTASFSVESAAESESPGDGAAAAEVEPLPIDLATIVPEDEAVEPMAVEQPMLVIAEPLESEG